MFEVFLSNNAAKVLRNMGEKLLGKIRVALERLENTPLPVKEYDLKKITGAENFYRIRLSGIRIVYSVDWNDKKINVLKIEKRGDSTYSRI